MSSSQSGPNEPIDKPASRITGRAQVGRAQVGRDSSAGRSAAGSQRPPRTGSPTTYGSSPRRRPRPRWGRIALVGLVVLALCSGLGLGGAYLYAKGIDDDLGRTDPFSALTGGRPPKTVSGAQNILLVGSDSRDPDAPFDKAGAWRTDTIILMHIPSSQDRAYLISIPRDLYVYVPQDAGAADCGNRRAKINASYAWGGLPLLVRTVECFTSVRVDHVAAIDFGGFKEVVDALGGVEMDIERTVKSIHKPYRTFKKGRQKLTGAQALDYIRQRKQFPDGDFARMRHQQQFMKALLDQAVSTQTVTNPGKLNDFLKAVSQAVIVDEQFSLVDMALQFRSLRSDDLEFMTSPHRGSDMINGESVVVSDRDKALSLYQAVGQDAMAQWVSANVAPSPSATKSK